MAKKAVRRDKRWGLFLKVEKMGVHECGVWKKATGGNTTYRWIEDYDGYPIVRFTLCVSNRPVTVHHRSKDGQAYIRTRNGRLTFEELVGVTPIEIEKYKFSHGAAESAFGGTMIDSRSFAHMQGDRLYVARSWW